MSIISCLHLHSVGCHQGQHFCIILPTAPHSLSKTKARFLKQKALIFLILDGVLYWKNVVGIILKFLLEDDAGKIMHELHEGKSGGHLY